MILFEEPVTLHHSEEGVQISRESLRTFSDILIQLVQIGWNISTTFKKQMNGSKFVKTEEIGCAIFISVGKEQTKRIQPREAEDKECRRLVCRLATERLQKEQATPKIIMRKTGKKQNNAHFFSVFSFLGTSFFKSKNETAAMSSPSA